MSSFKLNVHCNCMSLWCKINEIAAKRTISIFKPIARADIQVKATEMTAPTKNTNEAAAQKKMNNHS